MAGTDSDVLEGVFAISKPSVVSSGQLLLDLQDAFSKASLFAPLLTATRAKRMEQVAQQATSKTGKDDEEANGRFFRMGHGGTLDPLASGILIVGIGRGTKSLQKYLGCTKMYETVVLFGKSTDTYDVDGEITAEKDCQHVDEALVREKLRSFKGTFRQMPPVYSALKIDGVKACDYLRAGKDLPRALEDREVCVEECDVLEWMNAGSHDYKWPDHSSAATAPAVKIQITVSSGFYVRSFAYDLGISCGTLGTMAELVRTRQADFAIRERTFTDTHLPAVTYEELQAGEDIWAPIVRQHLMKWMSDNPLPGVQKHINGRDPNIKKLLSEEERSKTRQRFRGEWVGISRKERRRQQKAAKEASSMSK